MKLLDSLFLDFVIDFSGLKIPKTGKIGKGTKKCLFFSLSGSGKVLEALGRPAIHIPFRDIDFSNQFLKNRKSYKINIFDRGGAGN